MKVKIYVRNDDPYSSMLRNLLISNQIEFEAIEISRDKSLQKEMEELSGQDKTPVLVIGDKAYVGFDPDEMKKVLKDARESKDDAAA